MASVLAVDSVICLALLMDLKKEDYLDACLVLMMVILIAVDLASLTGDWFQMGWNLENHRIHLYFFLLKFDLGNLPLLTGFGCIFVMFYLSPSGMRIP